MDRISTNKFIVLTIFVPHFAFVTASHFAFLTASHFVFVTVPQLNLVDTLVYVHILPLAKVYTCTAKRFTPALSASCQYIRPLMRQTPYGSQECTQ
jgi:hypothetical protein